VKLSASRAALLVSDDAAQVIYLLRRLEGDQSNLDVARADAGMRTVRDMLRVWLSEPALGVRRDIGLL
jgi:hypothetical protein